MKKYFLIILSSLILLSSCANKEAKITPNETAETSNENSQANTETLDSPLKTFQQNSNPLLAIFLFGEEWGESNTVSMQSCSSEPNVPCAVAELDFSGEKPILNIDFGRIIPVEELIFEFGKANIRSISINANGEEIYQQEPFLNNPESPLNRVSYLGGIETDKLSIIFTLEGDVSSKELSISTMECYSEAPVKQETDFEIVGYIPVSESQNLPSDISSIIIGNAYWDESGNIQSQTNVPGKAATWCTVNPKGELIRSSSAGDTINTPEKRKKLAESLSLYCKDNNYIGIDIDWEFPEQDEWADYSLFLVELKEILARDGYKLSTAFYPNDITLSKKAIDSIDYVNIMAYDQFDDKGYHSTFQAAYSSIDYFLNLGFSPRQLRLGIPLYGRPLNKTNQWPLLKDSGLDNPFQNIKDNIFYNNRTLIMDKSALAQSMQLSGVMLYHLNADYSEDSIKQSLLDYSKALENKNLSN